MRYTGRITEWHDDKGYGFVTPNGGGDRAFVHIKALGRTSRRPTAGTLISYTTVRDNKGRLNATEVRFAGSPTRAAAPSQRGFPSAGIALGIVIALALALAWHFAFIPHALSLLYAGMSLLALALYAIDKSAAMSDRRRIPERNLHLIALLGGWPGPLLAQRPVPAQVPQAGPPGGVLDHGGAESGGVGLAADSRHPMTVRHIRWPHSGPKSHAPNPLHPQADLHRH